MNWSKWYFQPGEAYLKSEVVGACDGRTREGGVIRKESNNRMVRLIEQYAPDTIKWSPKTEGGWGASPFNANNWRTLDGAPILPSDVELPDVDVSRPRP